MRQEGCRDPLHSRDPSEIRQEMYGRHATKGASVIFRPSPSLTQTRLCWGYVEEDQIWATGWLRQERVHRV